MAVSVSIDDQAVWWTGGLNVDADGAPNAYGPNNSGLDWTANAGHEGQWYGVVVGADGNPIVQTVSDPFPGMFVSTTSLQDHSKATTDPRRYVDATHVPYLSVPSNEIHQHGLRPGDVGIAHCHKTGRTCAGVVADVGPANKYGEASVAMAVALGIPSSPRNGGCNDGVTVIVFRDSNRGWPRSNQEVATQVQELLQTRPDLQKLLTG